MPSVQDMNTPIAYWGNTGLVLSETPKALEHAINLAPNLSFVEGTLLGEVTATPGTYKVYAGSTVGTPAAITPTLTTSTTGGSLAAATPYYIVFAYTNGAGETVKSTEASITTGAGTTNSINVTTPTHLPAGSTGINVYMGTVSGTQYFVGNSLTTTYLITAPAVGTRAPVGSSTAVAASDGSQNAKCIARYACTTDANGLIYIGSNAAVSTGSPVLPVAGSTGFGSAAYASLCVDAIFGGIECNAGDLVGLDTAALTAGFGRLENGTIANGRFRLA